MVFFFGDLNYRLVELTNMQVKEICSRKDYERLKPFDELITAFKRHGRANNNEDQDELQYQFYRDFTEGHINFAPTYKYDKRSQIYDTSKKQRVPAWCDRILWKIADNESQEIVQKSLNCAQECNFSDHRPVMAQFEFYSNKINVEETSRKQENYFKTVRFQSLVELSRQKSLTSAHPFL